MGTWSLWLHTRTSRNQCLKPARRNLKADPTGLLKKRERIYIYIYIYNIHIFYIYIYISIYVYIQIYIYIYVYIYIYIYTYVLYVYIYVLYTNYDDEHYYLFGYITHYV